jgi:Protein of unknown function (DUF3431)
MAEYLRNMISLFEHENLHPTVQFIIARYEEPLIWLSSLPKKNVLVYNKGSSDVGGDYPTIPLPNVGREAHTYLHYILTHYDQLPDICVFLQGRINDHMNGAQGMSEGLFVNRLAVDAYTYGLSRNMIYLANFDHHDTKWAHPDFNLQPYFQETLRDQFKVADPTRVKFADWFKDYIGEEYPVKDVLIYGGAIFAVRRDLILQRPREYYMRIYETLMKENSPLEGHFMERSWKYVFLSGSDGGKIHPQLAKYCSWKNNL